MINIQDLENLPRVSSAGINDDVILRQGNQLVKIKVSDLISGLAGAAGFSGTFEGATETATIVNGIITEVA